MKALIVNTEQFQGDDVPNEVKEFIARYPDCFIVLDESSKIKTTNPCKDSKKSKRTQNILKLNTVGQRCILTGTLMSKSPCNAYDQMNFLKDGFFTESMTAFAERYVCRQQLQKSRYTRITVPEKLWKQYHNALNSTDKAYVQYKSQQMSFYNGIDYDTQKHIKKNKDYKPFKNLKELWERVSPFCMIARKEDIGDMPPKIYKTIYVDLTAEQKKLYNSLVKEYSTDSLTVENPLELTTRLQDVCNGFEPVDRNFGTEENKDVVLKPLKENPKVKAFMDLLDELGQQQIVVWTSRTSLLNALKKELDKEDYKYVVYDGKTSEKEKQNALDMFEQKKVQVFLANQRSGAYGLNALKECDYACYICNDASVEVRQQSEDRIHRGMVTRNKTIIDIVCGGTVEDRTTQLLKLGKELMESDKENLSVDVFAYDENYIPAF